MVLEGKTALITGAATGIGRETAKLFAKEGARIAIADIKVKEAEETVQMIRDGGGEAFFIPADMSRVDEIQEMVKSAVGHFQKLDIFFHNAGVAGPGYLDLTEEEEYDLTMAVNLKAAFFGAKFAAPELRKAGGGNILFTGSGAAFRPSTASPVYSVTKAGLVMLTRCLAYYLGGDAIRVNCICPGIVETPLWPNFVSRNPEVNEAEFTRQYVERRAIKRFGLPEEMAQAALFLVSPQASWITGVALPVDGGGAAG